MVGKAFEVREEIVGVETFQPRHHLTVKGKAPLLQQRLVGDLLRQGMLEHVLEVRDHPRFVQELARLEHGQTRSGADVRLAGHCLEEREGHLSPDDRRRLQQALVFG